MTLKAATGWNNNPDKFANLTAYSSPTTAYNSATTAFSNDNAALDDFGKIAESWDQTTKTPAAWSANTAANTNLYLYDSASNTYDSASQTFDGIVTGEDFGDQQTPTVWREA